MSVPTQLPVLIEGDWDHSSKKWRGVALAAEALVSVVLLTARGKTDWCKSERGDAAELGLTFALFPFEDPQVVQVNVTAGGGGRRFATRLPSVNYRPALPPELRVSTGERFPLATVEGDPRVDVSLILVAVRDVAVGRKGLWHIREQAAAGLDESLFKILTGARTGQLRAA